MTTTTANPAIIALLGTANFANETRSDFDDLVAHMPRRYVSVSDHTRIVPGADDLIHPNAGNGSGNGRGGVVPIPDMRGHAVKGDAETTHAPNDLRTVAQRDLMIKLVNDIGVLDIDAGMAALEYTVKMTDAGRWTAGRGGNASDWIGRMIAKYRELRNMPRPILAPPVGPVAEVVVPAALVGSVAHTDLIVRETKTGKPMPQYYAVDIEGTTKFYRVKAGTKPGWWWIDAQASDEFHPVRNVSTKNTILRAIIAAGPEECMRNYGRLIEHCGRCHRTLTDATSRANGIGPECDGKL